MASTDYGPEVRGAMQNAKPKQPKFPPRKGANPQSAKEPGPEDNPADMARDKARGIIEGSPQDEALDAKSVGMPPDAHHVAAAAGIAHAILGNRGMR